MWATCVDSQPQLVVMRHGQSLWTDPAQNRFAGWVDIPLTDKGRRQAARAGELIAESGIRPTTCFTSVLGRAIETADIVMASAGLAGIATKRTWRLNERHYGAFQGRTRPEMRAALGDELFARYRRSYDVRPPEIEPDDAFSQANDPRYQLDDGYGDPRPADVRGESLEDVRARLAPWWADHVSKALLAGESVLVVTHGSVLRAIMMDVEGIGPDSISSVNVPTGIPRVWDVNVSQDGDLQFSHGRYLDEDAAQRGIQEVHQLGRAK